MRNYNQFGLLTIMSAIAFSSASVADSTVIFGGVDTMDKSTSVYVGGVNAMNGDLDTSGILLRTVIGGGSYEYDTTAVIGGEVDGDRLRLEAGAGYQHVMEKAKVSVYVGVDYQDHDLSPNDVQNDVRGDETGGAIQAEAYSRNSKVDLNIISSYSTAFDTYWVRGRGGYDLGPVTLGVEAITAGSESYDEDRYGAYGIIPVSDKTSVNLSVGHSKSDGDNSRSDDSGGYATVGFSASF